MNRTPRVASIASALAVLLVLQVTALLLPRSTSHPSAAPRPTSTPTVVPRPSMPAPVTTPSRALRPPDPPGQPAVPTVLVTGRVLDESGRPVAGATVIDQRHHGGFETFFTAFTALATLGLACTTGICDTDTTRATTASDGRFDLHLPTTGDLAVVGTHDLTVGLGQTATVLQHDYRGKPLSVGVVHLLRSRPAVARRGGQVAVSVPPVPAALGGDLTSSAVFFGPDQRPGLTVSDVRGSTSIDGRLVEQGLTMMGVSASGKDALGRKVVYSSGTVPVPTGPTPLSRGRACFGYGPGDARFVLAGCHFTDGRIGTEVGTDFRLGDLACQSQKRCTKNNSKLLLDLGSVRAVSAVVLHGCSFTCSVEVSSDGSHFVAAGETDGSHDDDVLLGLTSHQARYVRVYYEFSIDLSGTAREASVF